MAQSNLYKYGSAVSQSVDVTDDDARDLGDVDVKSFTGALDVSDRAARDLGQVDVVNTVGVSPTAPTGVENSNATQIDPATESTLASVLTRDLQDSQGNTIDPLASQDAAPETDQTTAASTNVSVTLDAFRKDVDFYVKVNGSATLTVEVLTPSGNWVTFDTVSYSNAQEEVEQFTTAFNQIRASLNQNVDRLEVSAKGV